MKKRLLVLVISLVLVLAGDVLTPDLETVFANGDACGYVGKFERIALAQEAEATYFGDGLLFQNGLSWASTAEEILAAVGKSMEDAVASGDMLMITGGAQSAGAYPVKDSFYALLNDRLAITAYLIDVDGADRAQLWDSLREANIGAVALTQEKAIEKAEPYVSILGGSMAGITDMYAMETTDGVIILTDTSNGPDELAIGYFNPAAFTDSQSREQTEEDESQAAITQCPMFPENVTWASTPEEACEMMGLRMNRIRYYETFQILALDYIDVPAIAGDYPDVSLLYSAGEMMAVAWDVEAYDSVLRFWDGLRLACQGFDAIAPDALAEAAKYLLGSQSALVSLDGAEILNAGNGLVYIKQPQDNEYVRLVCVRMSRLMELQQEQARLANETSRGFDSPEACAKAVVGALGNMDMQAFFDCFAIEEAAHGFDISMYLDRVGTLNMQATLYRPSNDVNIAINEAYLTNDLLRRLAMGSQVLSGYWDNQKGNMPLLVKDSSVEELASRTESTRALGKLMMQSMTDAALFNRDYAEMKANAGWRYIAYGFYDWREIMVTLDCDENTVYMPLGFVRVNGRWLAAPFPSILSNYVNMPDCLLSNESIAE